MALTGYKRSCGKRSGGIRSIALVEADKIQSVTKAPDGERFSAVELNDGASFVGYRFEEDQALYEETVSYDSGSLMVTHSLSMALGRMDAASRQAVEELIEASPCGIVAVVVTNNGDALLVGYSEKFGTERALHLDRSIGTTGRKLSDSTSESIVLVSTDTGKAGLLTEEAVVL